MCRSAESIKSCNSPIDGVSVISKTMKNHNGEVKDDNTSTATILSFYIVLNLSKKA